MLPRVASLVRRVEVDPCQALEVVKVVLNHRAWNSIDFNIQEVPAKAMTMHCEDLASCCVALLSFNRVDFSNRLGFVAGAIVIAASNHGMFHMHGIANTEAEFNIDVIGRGDGAHNSTDLNLLPARKIDAFFNETLEIDTIAIEADLCPRQLRQSSASLFLCSSEVNKECHFRARIYHRWRQIV